MKKIEMLSLQASEQERRDFQVNLLETRVRELEHIVHRLLKDRVHQEEADVWLELCENQKSFMPALSVIRGRGKRMAELMDRWPDKQKWNEQKQAEE
jgi:hypothetical protein